MTENDQELPFWEHIGELRKTILLSGGAILSGMCIALYFYPQVMGFLTFPLENQSLKKYPVTITRIENHTTKPQKYQTKEASIVTSHQVEVLKNEEYLINPDGYLEIREIDSRTQLAILSPSEGMITVLKTCFWASLIITSPIWLYLILRFIAPALRIQEKIMIFPFLICTIILSALGMLFGYFITIPLANAYLNGFNKSLGINFWRLQDYMDYTWLLLSSNALAFEFFVILIFLVHYGKITPDAMRRHWRGVCLSIFIISALLTPPDVLTQLLLAIPLLGLYELAILYGKLRHKKSYPQATLVNEE